MGRMHGQAIFDMPTLHNYDTPLQVEEIEQNTTKLESLSINKM